MYIAKIVRKRRQISLKKIIVTQFPNVTKVPTKKIADNLKVIVEKKKSNYLKVKNHPYEIYNFFKIRKPYQRHESPN